MGRGSLQAVVSPQNARVKLAASLVRRKERSKRGLVLVEGERLVRQAIAFGASFEFFLVDEGKVDPELFEQVRRTGADVLVASEQILRKVADTQSPQGVLGVAKAVDEQSLSLAEAEWVVVADGIQDPGNLGTIQRVATAVGVDGVVLTRGTVDPKHPRVIRASAGAYFRTRLSTEWEPDNLSRRLRELSFQIVAADADGTEEAFSFEWARRTAVVIGSEANGPDPLLIPTHQVRIPMPGGGESLNAGVAAGVLLYQAWAKRNGR